MSRPAPKPKRKAATVQVPDLTEDAAERKRVLNVLAQRRYRERKREHLKQLESHAESNSSSSTVPEADDSSPSTSGSGTTQSRDSPANPPAAPKVTVSPDSVDFAFAAAVDFRESLSISNASGWTPELDQPLQAWPAATDSPSFPGSPISAAPTIASSFHHTTTTSTSPSSLDSTDWPTLRDMDFSSALQTVSTRSFNFPDERNTHILELKLLRGTMTIAQAMNIDDLLWSLDATSPFTDPSLSGLSFDHLPVNLRPTKVQQLIPHHPALDVIAWPTVRDKLIMVFSQPPEVRPPVASSPTALMELIYDIEDSAEGVRIWGDDPCNMDNWEAGETFFKRWWWAFDSKIIAKSNEWRRKRGAPLLGAEKGFVVGEV